MPKSGHLWFDNHNNYFLSHHFQMAGSTKVGLKFYLIENIKFVEFPFELKWATSLMTPVQPFQ
jgi:hypothetical protein